MSNEHAVCLPSSQQTICLGDNHSILSHTTRSAQVRPRLVGLRNRTRHSSYCSPNARNMVWRISLLLAKQRYRIDYGRSSPKTCIHCVTVHGICVKLMRNTKPTVKTQNFVNRDRITSTRPQLPCVDSSCENTMPNSMQVTYGTCSLMIIFKTGRDNIGESKANTYKCIY